MQVLSTSTSSQTFSVIPRIYSNYVILKLRNESTDVLTSYNLVTNTSGDYLEITNTYSLKEGEFYSYTICDIGQEYVERVSLDGGTFEISSCFYDFYDELGNNDIYKGKIFCTNQTINQAENEYYNINKDVYTQQESNNEYIIIDG